MSLIREQIAELKLADCIYCGEESSLIENRINEIDRVNPALGYVSENCVSACRMCNSAKSNLNIDDFLLWIMEIKKNYSKLPKTSKEALVIIANNAKIIAEP